MYATQSKQVRVPVVRGGPGPWGEQRPGHGECVFLACLHVGKPPTDLDRPVRLDSTYMVGRQGRSCGARWRERPAARRRVRAQAGVQGKTYHKEDVHNHLQHKGGRTKGRERTSRQGNKDEEYERPAVEHAIDTLGFSAQRPASRLEKIENALSVCVGLPLRTISRDPEYILGGGWHSYLLVFMSWRWVWEIQCPLPGAQRWATWL